MRALAAGAETELTMEWSETFRRKVTSAEDAVRSIRSYDHVWVHAGCNAPTELVDAMTARAKEKGFNFPYLFDETQQVARAYDAACTPDVFVFGPDRKLVYNGRIDDSWQDEGAVTRRDLRAVIDATLEGRPHGLDVVPSMGCSIKWKP